MKNLRDMIRFAEQSKTQKNKNSKPINLTFYLDYGALMKEHLDSLDNFINRHEKLNCSLDYNQKVLLTGERNIWPNFENLTWENICKECKNLHILGKFLPRKSLFL